MNYLDLMNLGSQLAGGIVSGRGAFPQQNNNGRGMATLYTPIPQTASQSAQTLAATLAPQMPTAASMPQPSLTAAALPADVYSTQALQAMPSGRSGNLASGMKIDYAQAAKTDPASYKYYYVPDTNTPAMQAQINQLNPDNGDYTLRNLQNISLNNSLYSNNSTDIPGYTKQDATEKQGLLNSVWPAAIPLALAALGPMGLGAFGTGGAGAAAGTAATEGALTGGAAAGAAAPAATGATSLWATPGSLSGMIAGETGLGPLMAGGITPGMAPLAATGATSGGLSGLMTKLGLSGGSGLLGLDPKKLLSTTILANSLAGMAGLNGSGSNGVAPQVQVNNVPRATHYGK